MGFGGTEKFESAETGQTHVLPRQVAGEKDKLMGLEQLWCGFMVNGSRRGTSCSNDRISNETVPMADVSPPGRGVPCAAAYVPRLAINTPMPNYLKAVNVDTSESQQHL